MWTSSDRITCINGKPPVYEDEICKKWLRLRSIQSDREAHRFDHRESRSNSMANIIRSVCRMSQTIWRSRVKIRKQLVCAQIRKNQDNDDGGWKRYWRWWKIERCSERKKWIETLPLVSPHLRSSDRHHSVRSNLTRHNLQYHDVSNDTVGVLLREYSVLVSYETFGIWANETKGILISIVIHSCH